MVEAEVEQRQIEKGLHSTVEQRRETEEPKGEVAEALPEVTQCQPQIRAVAEREWEQRVQNLLACVSLAALEVAMASVVVSCSEAGLSLALN